MKQAPQVWFEKLSTMITSLVFHSSDHDSYLFLKTNSHGHILQSLYIDYMIIKGDEVDEIDELKLDLTKQFEMKDLGRFCFFLGLRLDTPLEVTFFINLNILSTFLNRLAFLILDQQIAFLNSI